MSNIEEKVALGFDELYLAPPENKAELKEMRHDATLLLTEQMETFCRELVLFGRIPTTAYEIAFSTQDPDTGGLVKPDAASWQASKLLRLPEVVARIKELRNEILTWYKMPREEMLMALRAIALDPMAKRSDQLTALKQIAQAEGYNVEAEAPQGAKIVINMPFSPKKLGSNEPLVIDAESNRV